MAGVELKIGQTVEFEGQEFVLYCVNRTNDLEGRTVTIHGMDQQRAMKHMAEQEARRRALEHTERVEKIMPKMELAIDQALE